MNISVDSINWQRHSLLDKTGGYMLTHIKWSDWLVRNTEECQHQSYDERHNIIHCHICTTIALQQAHTVLALVLHSSTTAVSKFHYCKKTRVTYITVMCAVHINKHPESTSCPWYKLFTYSLYMRSVCPSSICEHKTSEDWRKEGWAV